MKKEHGVLEFIWAMMINFLMVWYLEEFYVLEQNVLSSHHEMNVI